VKGLLKYGIIWSLKACEDMHIEVTTHKQIQNYLSVSVELSEVSCLLIPIILGHWIKKLFLMGFEILGMRFPREGTIFNIIKNHLTLSRPRVPVGTYIDFTLSNARGFYSSMGNPLGREGLREKKQQQNFTTAWLIPIELVWVLDMERM